MRAVIQRVDRACVKINHQELSSINKGVLVLLGVEKEDTEVDADYILGTGEGIGNFKNILG